MADYSREPYPPRADRYAPAGSQYDEYAPSGSGQRRPYDDQSQMHPGYEPRGRDPPSGEHYSSYNEPRDRESRARGQYDDYNEPQGHGLPSRDQYSEPRRREPVDSYNEPPPANRYDDTRRTSDHHHRSGIPPPPTDEELAASAQEPLPHEGNQLAPYEEEKAYAEYQRGEEEREAYYARPPPTDYDRRPLSIDRYDQRPSPPEHHSRRAPSADYYDHRPRRHTNDNDRRRDEQPPREKERDLAGPLIGGGAGALLGHELIGKGALGTIGGAVVGAIAAKGMENYEQKKRREKDEERQRIRREYDSEVYDPRGSYRNSNFYDSQYASPAASAHGSARAPPRRAGPPRRHRKKPSSSSDSFTSDD